MRHRYTLPVTALLLMFFVVAAFVPAEGASVKKRNIADLISLGDQIIVGHIVQVRDGLDANNVPYTEVTVDIRETPKGTAAGTYTFRQFGLIEPMDMGNGKTNLNVTPDGWPTYSQGTDVVLFLYKAAAWTGLRTTVGLKQGSFVIEDGQVTNPYHNAGLFEGVDVDRRGLSQKEIAMLEMKHGRIPEDMFMGFLRKAMDEQWFPHEEAE